MQKFKLSLLSAAVGAALLFSSGAEACTLNAWTVNGSIVGSAPNLVPGGPAHTNNTVRRYSGICGMRASAASNYVQNDDPAADQIFRARFYVLTGSHLGQRHRFIRPATTPTTSEIEVDRQPRYQRDPGAPPRRHAGQLLHQLGGVAGIRSRWR